MGKLLEMNEKKYLFIRCEYLSNLLHVDDFIVAVLLEDHIF